MLMMDHATGWQARPRGPGMTDDKGDRARILVIDDDPAMRQMLTTYLEQNNLAVSSAQGRRDMSSHFMRREPDLVILDLHLGREEGLDLLREIRASSDVPVIIATGQRHEEVDRVLGLELGADDFVTKPFGLRELLARVRAVLRRRSPARAGGSAGIDRRRFLFGGWQLDCTTRRLTGPDGSAVPLTKGEYALLIAFLEAPQRPLTRLHLLQATRVHEDVFDRSIDVQILRLRRKLETESGMPGIVQTVRGIGYMFALPVEIA